MQAERKFSSLLRKTLSLLLCTVFALSLFCVGSHAAVPDLPDLSGAESVYLWNAEYDKVIVQKGGSELIYPASMTKIMTGLVAIELIGDKLDEKVTLSADMLAGSHGTSMKLKADEVLSYRDLLYAAICGGFNDAANALAAASAGSVSAFVAKMNEKAHSLGAVSTHYTNPTGWHDDAMVTTLSDTAIIAKAAMKNEIYVKVSSAQSYAVEATNKSSKFTVHNRNGLIASYYAEGYYNKRAEGLAAGMTDEGGYCVATFAQYDDLTYLCIVMGATEQNEVIKSYSIANELITHAIYYFDEVEAIKAGDFVANVPLHNAAKGANDEDFYMLPCTVPSDATVFACFDYKEGYELELRPYFYADNTHAPVREGEVIGGVDIFVDGSLCGTSPLCASHTVEENAFLVMMNNAKNLLVSRGFIAFTITFIILFAVYFYFEELRSLQKRKKKFRFDRPY